MEDLINVEELKMLVFEKQVDLINTILSKEQEIADLKAEESKISAQRKYKEAQLNNFKNEIKGILDNNGIEKIETEAGKIQLRKNPISIEVEDIEKVPDEYKTIKITTSVDKKKITENFKSTGEIIEGVKIITDSTSLQIK